ncbi:MAG: SusC/RagA family TonB-linked outer membrane protein [Hymenobacteraceae bacterium]|nr:SusC/RagA family TonB-linked outer membrane protein [Hymenobacteraceae bacterium]
MEKQLPHFHKRRYSLRKGILLCSCLFVMGSASVAHPAVAAAGSARLLQGEKVPVKGKVTAKDDGSTLPGVTILANGKPVGITNADGDFQVSVETGTALTFQYIGFLAQQVTITKSEENLVVVMANDNKQLSEVVVTALGIKREEKALGYAVSQVKGEEITNAISNNWTDALSGKVAGLNMIKSGGGPAGSNKIILRGENSLDGNSEALIVVDGVIISGSSGKMTGTGSGSYLGGDSPVDFGTGLGDINPEDIESVSVLKGPGAAALYGARGANGAIIITTKSGRPTQKGIGVTINSNTSLGSISRWPDYQYEYGQGAAGQDTWYSYNATEDGPSTRSTSSAWGPRFDGQMYYQYDPITRTKGEERTPWVPYKNNRKDFFETSKTYNNSVSIEGGNARTSARLSFTNLQNSWIIPNTGYTRNTVALSLNQKVTDKLQLATKVNYTNKYSDNLPSTGYNNQTIMYFIRGLVPNADINWFKDYWLPGQEQLAQTRPFSSLLDNPYLQAYEMLNKSNRNGVVGNVSATYNFTENLSVLLRTAMDFSYEERSQQRPKNTQKFADGMFRTQSIFAQEVNSDFLVRYKRPLSAKFESDFSVGGSRMNNRYVRESLHANRLLYPGIYSFANSKDIPVAYPYRSQYAVNSLYGMAQFSFDNFLFLDLTARNDWTSTLATPTSTKNTSFFYPSVNLSTSLSDIIQMPAAISFAKLRGSWSQVGSGGTTPYLTAYTYVSEPFPSGLSNPTAIANENLQPLLTTSIEFGADVRFFQSRLGLDVSVYQNNTRNQIFVVPVDRATGYSGVVLNSGLVQNRGLELQTNAALLKKKGGLNWTMFATYATNLNKVVELADSIDTYVMSTGPANRGSVEARPGGRMGALYGLGYERSPDGQIVYNELGYPILAQTAQYLGNTTPRWRASLGNEFSYKQFRLNVLFDGQFGGVAYSLTHAVLAEEGKLTKTLPGRYNGIIGNGVIMNGDGSYRPNDVMATNIQAYYSEHFKRDNVEANTFSTDFIKLREMRFDYVLPKNLLEKVRLQRASIGVYGRDLFMFTHWPAFDPEFGTLDDGEISAGFEIGQFPSTRTFGLNLTVGI